MIEFQQYSKRDMTGEHTADVCGACNRGETFRGNKNVKKSFKKPDAKGDNETMCYVAQGLIAKGEARGEQKMVKLMEHLLSNGLMEELQKALADEDARAKMYEEYGINTTIDLLLSKSEMVSA